MILPSRCPRALLGDPGLLFLTGCDNLVQDTRSLPSPMSVTYNSENVFARILRKELPCRPVLETEFLLAFHDLHPKAPVHVLAIPKGPYCNAVEFHQKAEVKDIAGFYQDLNKVIALLGLDSCRLMTNVGKDAGQIVDHFHMHILGGRVLKEAP